MNNFKFFQNQYKLKEFVRNPFPLLVYEVQTVFCDINFSYFVKVTNSLQMFHIPFRIFLVEALLSMKHSVPGLATVAVLFRFAI